MNNEIISADIKKCQKSSFSHFLYYMAIISAGSTIVAIATGPAVFCNKSYLLQYIQKFVQSKKSVFC